MEYKIDTKSHTSFSELNKVETPQGTDVDVIAVKERKRIKPPLHVKLRKVKYRYNTVPNLFFVHTDRRIDHYYHQYLLLS